MDKKEQQLQKEPMEIIKKIKDGKENEGILRQAVFQAFTEIPNQIDLEVKQRFTLYGKDAKRNSYALQADIIQTKVIPQLSDLIDKLSAERTRLRQKESIEIEELIPNPWNWRRMAKRVDLQYDYDFIYTFTSRLLHATPVSLTASQQNLEISEIESFLNYIYVRLHDFVNMAEVELERLT